MTSEIRARRLQRLKDAGLYLVTDDRLGEAELLARLQQALEAGARVIQFRAKLIDRGPFLGQAERVQRLSRDYGALFLVNDAVDVAALLGADGVHLGQTDLPPAAARRIVGPDSIIGVSVSAVDQARVALSDPAVDYLGVGAMYATDTKQDAEHGGLELLRAVRAAIPLPLIAIGGITPQRAPEIWAAGADLVAVVSAVFGAPNPAATTEALLKSRPGQSGQLPSGDLRSQ